MYEGEGKGEPIAFRGISRESIDDAIRAAVDASGAESGTTFVVTHIEVETIDDPNVGSYKVTLSPHP
jgi:flavin-binding protein dodecin